MNKSASMHLPVIILCEGTINEGNRLADIRCRRFSDILRIKEDHYPCSQIHLLDFLINGAKHFTMSKPSQIW